MSPGGEELRRLVEESGHGLAGTKKRKLADVLTERPDLIEFVDEYADYRESVSHSATTPAAAHSIATALNQASKQPKK